MLFLDVFKDVNYSKKYFQNLLYLSKSKFSLKVCLLKNI